MDFVIYSYLQIFSGSREEWKLKDDLGSNDDDHDCALKYQPLAQLGPLLVVEAI